MTVFRPEVQALRAVAVASVVLYHLWPNRLPGGYVGVDVFFVISGFLITGHLMREVNATGGVSLAQFWGRRIRRLLPAATLVLASSFVAMLAFVPQPLWQRTVTEIGAGALYLQNWVLAANSVDYLGADGTATIVQHFWSLSVEEQFYIVWPILIALALLLPRRRWVLPAVLVVVFVASLACSISMPDDSGYFSTATRAWEFAGGGLLAMSRVTLPRFVSWFGLGAIAASVLFYTPAMHFPGYAALLPVIGTVLVIAGQGLPNLRPVRAIGDWSYSLYLWHWPLIVTVPYVTGHALGTLEKLAIIAVAVGLAAFTKRFVEDPVRRSRRVHSYALAAVTVGALALASTGTWLAVQTGTDAAAAAVAEASVSDSCFGAAALVEPGCERPFAVPDDLDAAFWATDKGSLGRCNSSGTEVELCAFGDTTAPAHTVALVGNSHAGHLVAALETYGRVHHWQVILMRKTGCSGATPMRVLEAMKQPCIDWSKSVNAAIVDPANGIDVVVFASNNDADHYVADRWLNEAERSTVVASISDHLEQLAKTKTVVVFGDVPGAVPTVVPECVDAHADEYDPCSTALPDPSDNLLEQAAPTSIDLTPYFCDATRCHVIIGGAIVYLDEHHLTASFSRSLAPYLGAALDRAIER